MATANNSEPILFQPSQQPDHTLTQKTGLVELHNDRLNRRCRVVTKPQHQPGSKVPDPEPNVPNSKLCSRVRPQAASALHTYFLLDIRVCPASTGRPQAPPKRLLAFHRNRFRPQRNTLLENNAARKQRCSETMHLPENRTSQRQLGIFSERQAQRKNAAG